MTPEHTCTGFADVPAHFHRDAPLDPHQRRRHDAVLSLLRTLPPGRVLDYGFGWGDIAWQASRTHPDIHAVDVEQRRVDFARSQYAPLPFDVCRPDGLDFPDASFDIVLSIVVLPFVPDDDAYLAALDEAGPFDTLTVDLLTESSFTDNDVTNDITYYYVVIAVDTDGNESAYSMVIQATPTARPDAPRGFYGRPGLDEAGLFWNEMGDQIIGYNIYRSEGGDFEKVNDEPVEGASYIDGGLTAGTTYSYKVTSLNGELESFQTDEVAVTPGESYTLQAEDGEPVGAISVEDEHAGHNGTGFVNFGENNSAIEFKNLSGFDGGPVTLELRYALGNNARTGRISVNGASQPYTMENTGAWTTWITDEITIELEAGFSNTLNIGTTGADFGNLDQITLTQKAVTAVNDHDLPLTLTQNYPNPFSDFTTIEYRITKPSAVSIQILNMLGQPVRTINNGMQQPGKYSVIWNATDNAGSRLKDGFYLYRIVAGDQAGSIKKMLLISGK